MAIQRKTGDVKRLIREHRKLSEELRKICLKAADLQTEIRTCADRLALKETISVLREIPVEELNREKRGFRIKALRDSGIQTLADAAEASEARLEAIQGISAEGAREIRSIAEQLAMKAGEGVKLRLNADERSAESSALVQAVCRYSRALSYSAEALALFKEYGETVETAMREAEAAAGLFRRLFSSAEKKKRAQAACDRLEELLDGEYGETARHIISSRDRQRAELTDPWKDFVSDSIRYYTVLEQICPDRFGPDDSRFGLPEELAEAVSREPIHSEGLFCTLRHYQEWGVKYILHQKRVLLGDEMGLGKTVQAIAVMVSLRGSGLSRFAVVCPASVLENWCREIRKHSDLPVFKVHGDGREKALADWNAEGGAAVTTYETTEHFILPPGAGIDLLVVDEAHYIKNAEAKRTRNVKALAARSERLLFMTGTALENKVDEMISLIRILQPEVAAEAERMASLSAAPQFREMVAPVYYRRKREDVLKELPDLIEKQEWCRLQREEARAYERAVLENRFADARRVSWNVPDAAQSSKAQRMLEIIADAAEDGRKIIVFSFFLDTVERVSRLLGSRCLEPITGSVSPARRQELVDEFEQAKPGTVLAAQIQSGGTGLNIQAASVVILCEPQFKPSIENQAIGRAYRMGQTRNVLVYRLLCEDTVDEWITELLTRKQAEFDAFADKSAAAAESLSLDDRTFREVMQQEAERIGAKGAAEA